MRQGCLVHRAGNVLAKVAKADADGVKAAYWRIFDDVTAPPGQAAVDQARADAAAFADQWGDKYPRAVACALADLPVLTAYLRFPTAHHKRIRHTNLLERTFGQSRR